MRSDFGHQAWLILAIVGVAKKECIFASGFVVSGPLKPIAGLLTPDADKLFFQHITKPTKSGEDHLDSYSNYKSNNFPTASESDRIKIPYQYTPSSSSNSQDTNGLRNSNGLSKWEEGGRNLATNSGDDYLVNGIPRRRGQKFDRNQDGQFSDGASKESLQNQLWRTQESLHERTNEVVQLKTELRLVQSRLEEQEAHYERFINDLQLKLGMGEGERRWSSIASRPRTVLSADNNSAVNHLGSRGFAEQATTTRATETSSTAATTEFHTKRDPMSAFYEDPNDGKSRVYEPYGISVSDAAPKRTAALWSNGQNPSSNFPSSQGYDERTTRADASFASPFSFTPTGTTTQRWQQDELPRYSNPSADKDVLPHLALDGFGMDVHGPGPHIQEEFNLQGDSIFDRGMGRIPPETSRNGPPPPPPYYYGDIAGVVPPAPPPGSFQAMWPREQQGLPINPDYLYNPSPTQFSSPQNHLITLNDQGTTSKAETIGDRAVASGYYGERTQHSGGAQSPKSVFYDLDRNSNTDKADDLPRGTGKTVATVNRSSQEGRADSTASVQRIQPKVSGEMGEFVRNDDIVAGVVDPFDHLSQRQQSYDGKTPYADREEKKKEQKVSYETTKQQNFGRPNHQGGEDNNGSTYNGSNVNNMMHPSEVGMEEEAMRVGQYGRDNFYGRSPAAGAGHGFPPQGRYDIPGNFDPNVPYGSGYNDSNNWNPPNFDAGLPFMDNFNGRNNVGFYPDPSFQPMYGQQPPGPFYPPHFMNDNMSERRRPDEVSVIRPDASAFTS